MVQEKIDSESVPQVQEEMPLPATFTFVMLIGITFFVLWLGVFALLMERW
jgi:hypothetical protein